MPQIPFNSPLQTRPTVDRTPGRPWAGLAKETERHDTAGAYTQNRQLLAPLLPEGAAQSPGTPIAVENVPPTPSASTRGLLFFVPGDGSTTDDHVYVGRLTTAGYTMDLLV